MMETAETTLLAPLLDEAEATSPKWPGLTEAFRQQRRALRQAEGMVYPAAGQPVSRPLTLLETVCQDALGFYHWGWLLGTSGNLSVRDPRITAEKGLYFWITASGLNKDQLTPADFILLNHQGRPPAFPVETMTPDQAGRKPSAETRLHTAIYRMIPDVAAVYHVHSPSVTWVTQRQTCADQISWLTLPAVEMLKGLGRATHEETVRIPVLPNHQDMKVLADQLTDLLQESPWTVPVFILRGHGAYTWGKTLDEAKRHVEILDFLFQMMVWDTLSPA